MTERDVEIKESCPCGSFSCDTIKDCGGGGFVYCLECGGETDWFENISDAIAAWDAGEVEKWL